MTRFISATITAACIAAAAGGAFAQSTEHKTSILTFSAPVQVPGMTLPAGTYRLQLANPASGNIWWVMNADRHVLVNMFSRPTRRTYEQTARGSDKPSVRFYETPLGTPPAIHFVYYPGDTWGAELVYPIEQAKQLAALTHQAILATDAGARTTGVPTLVFVQPDGTLSSPGLQAVETSGTTEPQPVATSGDGGDPAVAVP